MEFDDDDDDDNNDDDDNGDSDDMPLRRGHFWGVGNKSLCVRFNLTLNKPSNALNYFMYIVVFSMVLSNGIYIINHL